MSCTIGFFLNPVVDAFPLASTPPDLIFPVISPPGRYFGKISQDLDKAYHRDIGYIALFNDSRLIGKGLICVHAAKSLAKISVCELATTQVLT